METDHIDNLERLKLINQFSILTFLDPDNFHEYKKCIDILSYGYSLFYDQVFSGIYDEMLVEDQEFVIAVLEMFRLFDAYKQDHLDDDEIINHNHFYFAGFDGNNEGQHLGFTEYIIETLGKYNEQKKEEYENKRERSLNSHSPRIEVYERMLRKWEENDKDYKNRDVILSVLEAGNYPKE